MDDPEGTYDVTQPEPSALIESLRAFGYSLETAIADLVDNSIAAKAKNVWIRFEWKGSDSYISLKDDGEGMTESSIISAMRPGSQSPLKERSLKDLGRFGLGLKTASFSQCRRLTVVSKVNNGEIVKRCWDLDYVKIKKEWRLLKLIEPEPLTVINDTISVQGTIVIWEKMDRVSGNHRADDEKAYKRFLEGAEKVKQHLEMVFHRFLDYPNSLKIWINGRMITSWDPFMKSERATQELPVEKLLCDGKNLVITPYVLPHQSKVSTESHKIGSGPRGWNAQQGFYVYRNERLLVGGDWLSLGFQKEEHYKLARIQVDLPNSMDGEWQIDVKKSRAKIPGYLKSDFKRIAVLTRNNAVDIYRHRGKVVSRKHAQDFVFMWEQKTRHGKFFYSINREHPLVQQAYKNGVKIDLDALFSILEESIPVSHILVTNVGEPDKFSTPFENAPPEILQSVLLSSFSALLNTGVEEGEAKRRLLAMDPFSLFPDVVEVCLNEFLKDKK
ncbi:ATP-binding protein [Dyadobacter sp. Leaf189]|nr:ATP-binding protein [Dyadobacter sp. Leaf189]